MTAQELRSFFSLLRALAGSPPYLLLVSVLGWFAERFPNGEIHPVTSHNHSFRVYRDGVLSELSPEVSKRFAAFHRGLQNRPLLSAAPIKTLNRRDIRDLPFPGISPDNFWLALPSGPPGEERTWLCLSYPSPDPFAGRKLARWMRVVQSLHQSLVASRLGEVQEREKHFAAQEESIAFLVHQLKSPLAQIQGGLAEENENEAGRHRALRQLVSRTRGQVAGYLDLHRARRLKLQWIPLRSLAEEIRTYYHSIMNKSLKINTVFTDQSVLVWGNKMYLFEVFQNLIDNARQAMKNRGCVYLEATFPEKPQSVEKPSKHALQKMFLRVRDDGPGVPRWFHPKLFQPFAGLRPEGHGLGLCLCQRLVQHMEGSLEYMYLSESNDGGYFQINLTAKGGDHDA